MKVDSSKSFSRQNLELKENRERVIKEKQREINSIKKNYDKQIIDQRKIGDEKLAAVIDQNDHTIIESLNNKEARLNNIKESLEKTHSKFEKQYLVAKDKFDSDIAMLRDGYNEKAHYVHERGNELLNNTTSNTNDMIKNIKDESNAHLLEESSKARLAADSLSQRNEAFVTSVDKDYKNQIKKLEIDNKYAVGNLNKEQREELTRLQNDHLTKMSQTDEFQKKEALQQQDHHNETISSKQKAFEDKYKNLQTEHNSLMTRLKTKIDTEINKLKDYYTTTKNTITSKTNDEFYTVTKLQPQVTKMPDHYLFSIPVPKHEESTVHINAQDRGITVTQNRRYDDRIDNENGNTYKSKRSETLIHQFDVEDILEGSKVQRNYDEENSILTYKIAKR